jgi:hypothetical protein
MPRLHLLSAPRRVTLAGLLLAAAIAYSALLVSAYLHLTPPSSLAPDPRELNTILFDTKKPISRIERLLESIEGEMNRGGTMRPAFTDQSLDWESLTKNMSDNEKAVIQAQREAERLAFLDWVRSGASRESYENDDYALRDPAPARQITGDYLIGDRPADSATAPPHIRIRTLIADRCVTCHGEHGRHDTARYIALDTYDRLAPHLQPETTHSTARFWLVSALVGLYPLALVSGLAFYFTSHPANARRLLLATTFAALGGMSACWLAGQPASNAIHILLATFAVAAVGALVQTTASLAELVTTDRR